MKTQAWGWLMAGVMAAGLNASYHDGGLEWAHRIANQMEHNTAAVLALASGRADQFLAEARMVAGQSDSGQCPFSHGLTRVQARIDRSEMEFDRAQMVSDRERAAMDRWEANRVRIENELAAQSARLQVAMVGFTPGDLNVMKLSECPRVRVNVPVMPKIRIQVPAIHVSGTGTGPI